jgi:membrane-bound lytic murein transglycosylase B
MLDFLTVSRQRQTPRQRRFFALGAFFLILATGMGPALARRHHHTVPTPKPKPADDAKFYAFIESFRDEALQAGIRPRIYDRSMRGISLNTHIQDLNNKQPEFTRQIWDYLDSAVSDKRVAKGREKLQAHRRTLVRLQARFGVPKEILAAIWGLETNYGSQMGGYDMFEALATLAYDGRRTALGRRELIAALQMEQREHYRPKQMLSSWAGAFGQTQFMPSTFLTHAIDGNGNGRIDLWASPADALASTATMLDEAGWRRGEPWGYEVRLPAQFPYAEADPAHKAALSHWRALGVTTVDGAALPAGPDQGAILLPAGAHGPAFVTFHNFRTILRYNNATAYALAVSMLADRIAGHDEIQQSWPRGEEALSRDEAKAFQENLNRLGFDVGPVDGILGGKVRAALRDYQRAHGLKPDGFATQALLKRMEREIASKGG